MPPTGMKQKDDNPKKRDRYDWNTSWSSSLKQISCLLPVTETERGRALTKDTLIHMLRYFNFLQTHIRRLQSSLPSHCLPLVNNNEKESESESEDVPPPEPSTPPHTLKAKRKYICGRSRKKGSLNPELFNDKHPHEEEADKRVTTNSEHLTTRPDDKILSYVDTDSLPSSDDPSYSCGALMPVTPSSKTDSSADQESLCQGLGSQCSVCEELTGDEEGSQSSKDLGSSPLGSFLLKDRMLGVGDLPPLVKKQFPDSPTLPHTPVLPFLPLLGVRDGLNLSPSLLTSPARGLSHHLLPEGREELQTLFEDVWVTPKPAVPKVTPTPHDSYHGACGSSQSEEDDGGSDDVSWTPKLHLTIKKVSRGQRKRASSRSQAASDPSLKRKCVNGFIMFCRMNRRLYLRTHPGTPSTVVTKELAKLWHIMPKQERRVYCLKARHYSRQHNRNVRSEDRDADEDAEHCIPSPLHTLLAHRDLWVASVISPGK
ncbi:meiosis initiator protein-like isoform X2 [Trichomycterus rosablanca]|uniref:meiosis initiator protein-like isoform X2 n=1 Tax=Trichomycterus rosablanca TaxID=2290929 RepID=UPI002F3510A8